MSDARAGSSSPSLWPEIPTPGLRIAGMALQNGLMLHTVENWSAAIRADDGSIRVATGVKPSHLASSWAGRLPLLRGVAQMGDALALLPVLKREIAEAILPIEAPRVAAAVGASTLAALLLRGFGQRAGGRSPFAEEGGALVLTLVPVMVALRGSQLAAYHGAEHKAIGEFERSVNGLDSPVEKEHARCGSNMIAPLLLFNLGGNLLLRKTFRRPSPPAMLLTGLASLGAAMEVFRWMSRHPSSAIARVLAWPGYRLQHSLTTREPSEAQMEVARAALAELLRAEGLLGPEAAA